MITITIKWWMIVIALFMVPIAYYIILTLKEEDELEAVPKLITCTIIFWTIAIGITIGKIVL